MLLLPRLLLLLLRLSKETVQCRLEMHQERFDTDAQQQHDKEPNHQHVKDKEEVTVVLLLLLMVLLLLLMVVLLLLLLLLRLVGSTSPTQRIQWVGAHCTVSDLSTQQIFVFFSV